MRNRKTLIERFTRNHKRKPAADGLLIGWFSKLSICILNNGRFCCNLPINLKYKPK
jgi:hypothetical protein